LFWGSDNDVVPASIFQWNFELAELSRLREIGKPSNFSTTLGNGAIKLCATHEPEGGKRKDET